MTVTDFKSKIKAYISPFEEYTLFFLKWIFFGVIIGAAGGIIGAAFSKSITFVTHIRTQNDWLIYLLPIGGAIIAGLYSIFKVKGIGTNEVFEGVRTEKKVPVLLAPAVFAGSVITHLLGGSAGREGAALQLGGSIASLMGKIFKLSEKSRHILIMCGMSAIFSAVFGTPLCAVVFAVEVVSIGYMYSSALFPCIVSSITACFISGLFGITPESFTVDFIPRFGILSLSQVLLIGIICAAVSTVFCKTMHISGR
ncbi:MAG: chloride channel protein, partial [Clostridia bacterium]|nr:chloride channel protein [Clostridia bacterium]